MRYGLAVASIGAGVIHLTAASAHSEHALLFAFFVGSGFLQILWGTAVLAPRPKALFLQAGLAGNAALIGVWIASRVGSGITFVPGADHREPVGVKDTVTVMLEALLVAGAYVVLRFGRSAAMSIRLSERAIAPLAAATALLLIPGIVVPAHHHDHEHTDGHAGHLLAAGHEHTLIAGAAGHTHEADHATHALGAHAEHAATHTTGGHEHPASVESSTVEAAPASENTNIVAPIAANAIRASVRYGPFVLPPAGFGGEAHYNRIKQNIAKPCSDCYIVAAKPNLVYGDGSSANLNSGVMLHHAVWTRPSINDTTCGRNSAIGSQGERFFAAGNERTELRLPSGFGYYVGTDSWTLIAELMNHSDQTRNVFVTLDVWYRPTSDHLNKVTPVWMDEDNCGDSQYGVPAGKSSQLWTWRSTLTGRVVGTAGHVHNGGVKIALSNDSTKQQMCTSIAGYGRKAEYKGTIESMSMCVWDRIGTVRKGETLGIRAYYDSAQAQSDVMGIMLAFVYETNDLSGGSTPPQNEGPQEQEPPPSSHNHGP